MPPRSNIRPHVSRASNVCWSCLWHQRARIASLPRLPLQLLYDATNEISLGNGNGVPRDTVRTSAIDCELQEATRPGDSDGNLDSRRIQRRRLSGSPRRIAHGTNASSGISPRTNSRSAGRLVYTPSTEFRPYNSHGTKFVYSRRTLHTSRSVHTTESSTSISPERPEFNSAGDSPSVIREKLKKWQAEFGMPNADDHPIFANRPSSLESVQSMNNLVKLEEARFRQPSSSEDELTELESNEEDGNRDASFLKPGDLVELGGGTHAEPVLGVFVRQLPSQNQFLTMHGKWIHLKTRSAQFTVPGFIDPKMLEPLLPFLPQTDITEEELEKAQQFDTSIPRDISRPVVKKLLRFFREAEAAYRKNAHTLDNAYKTLCHEENTRMLTLEQIAHLLLGNHKNPVPLPATTLFAVRKALLHNRLGVTWDFRSYRVTGVFQIRPSKEVDRIQKVRTWVREYQDWLAQKATAQSEDSIPRPAGVEHVRSFLEKARRVVARSRRNRTPTASFTVSPSNVKYPITRDSPALRIVESEPFSETDQTIIRFLEDWAIVNRFSMEPHLQTIGSLVIRETGLYDEVGAYARDSGFMFLQELGVVSPFLDRSAFDEHLLLPTAKFSKQVEQLAREVHSEAAERKVKFVDTMEDLRHDWGDLEVFCIDAASAEEIDDGISIERIPGNDREVWVHVHVANPTAFFNKTHTLSRLAAHMTETLYTPQRSHPMLPRWATQKYFSLRKNKPCLTFSARLDQTGKILDKKIRPGFIRKVTSLTYEALEDVLRTGTSEALAERKVEITVGGDVPEYDVFRRPFLTETFSPQQKKDLTQLHELANARFKYREMKGGLALEKSEPVFSVYENARSPGLRPIFEEPSRHRGRIFEGDPVIRLETMRYKSWFDISASQSYLVREMMLLAAEVGAGWAVERNVPLNFRGSIQTLSDTALEHFLNTEYKENCDENGVPALHVGLKYLGYRGSTISTTVPTPHKFLGLPAYAKVTSPLRRFGDMMNHWQLESALREEATTKQSLIGSQKTRYLAFSADELKKRMLWITPRERLIAKVKTNSLKHWHAQLFFRAHYFNEAPISELQRVLVVQDPPDMSFFRVINLEYSVESMVKRPPPSSDLKIELGDIWEVRPTELNVFHRLLIYEPVKLIERRSLL